MRIRCTRETAEPPLSEVLSAAAFISLAISLLSLFSLIFAVSPLNGEDYALTASPEGLGLLDRLSWVVQRSHLQITTWNARLGEQLAIFWLNQPKAWFVIANTLVYITFCAILAGLATGTVKVDILFLRAWLAVCALCFLLWPRLEMFYWGSAAAGYLHPLTLTMMVLLPYALPGLGQRLEQGRLVFACWCLVGLAAGLSFENHPPAVLAYCAFESLRRIWKEDRIQLRSIIPAVFYALGWMILMATPSTTFRVDWYRKYFHLEARVLSPSHLEHRFSEALSVFYDASFGLLFVFVSCLVLVLVSRHRRSLMPVRLLALLAAGFLSSLAVVLAPYTEPRAFALLWIAIIVMITSWLIDNEWMKGLGTPLVLLIAIAALGAGASAWVEYERFARQVDTRAGYVHSRKGSGECREGLVIATIPVHSDTRVLSNRDAWVEENIDQVSRYFDCKLIVR